MVSQILTSKQILSLLESNRNLCETTLEYPSLTKCEPPRHLCTCIQASTKPESTLIHKLSNQTTITPERHHKASNKRSKMSNEQIELFPYQQAEEMQNKLYRKSRYQSTRRNENVGEEIIDNTD